MEKLTLEIAMKYFRAKIKYNGVVFLVYSYEMSTNNIIIVAEEKHSVAHISNCKLILRKIDSLTWKERDKIKSFKTIFRDEDGFQITSGKGWVYWYSDCETFDYLRSLSIDIDNLVERGIATYD